MKERLSIRLQRPRPPCCDECVAGDDIPCTGGFRMMDDVSRVGVRGQQSLQDLGMETAPGGDRDARPDRMPCQFVTEMNGRRIDLEELPALGLHGCGGP